MSAWIQDPGQKYGGSIAAPVSRATPDATATKEVAPVPTPKLSGMLNPGDPMFWFGVIAAGTVGLMAYSTGVVG